MTGELVDFGDAAARLRGADVELQRLGRLGHRRLDAFNRAWRNDGADYSPADRALFGSRDELLREGPLAIAAG